MPRTHGKYSVNYYLVVTTTVIVRGGSGVDGIPQDHWNASPGLSDSPSIVQISIQVLLGKPILTLGLTFLILSNEGF